MRERLGMPAAVTTTSRPPSVAAVSSTMRCPSAIRATSPTTTCTGPSAPTSAAVAVALSASMSARPTDAPSSRKSFTIAAPIPDAPPVTSATLPCSLVAMTLLRAR